jgi:tartrate dehydratase beta subunit/fumarate hydratase class I family protein
LEGVVELGGDPIVLENIPVLLLIDDKGNDFFQQFGL